MEKKQFIGIVLIFALLFALQWVNQPTEEQKQEYKRIQDSIALAQKNKTLESDSKPEIISQTQMSSDSGVTVNSQLYGIYGAFAKAAQGSEQEYILENEDLKITFTNKGGKIKNVWLKKYQTWLEGKDHETVKSELHLLNDNRDKFQYILPVGDARNKKVNTDELYFRAQKSGNNITFTAKGDRGTYFTQTYSLRDKGFNIDYDISHSGLDLTDDSNIELQWKVYLKILEKAHSYEKNYSTVFYRQKEDVSHLSYTGADEEELEEGGIEWIANLNQFFNSTLMSGDTPFKSAKFDVVVPENVEEVGYLKVCNSTVVLPNTQNMKMDFYIGPNDYTNLEAYDNDLEMVIGFGWNIFGALNRHVIRPMFLGLAGIFGSMGFSIIVLIFIIKSLLYPLNYKMLLSSTKMSVLKPEIQKIKDKYKDDNQQVQMKTMELYRKYGVSPFGGCLPMLLQMPIWFALFRFFPAAIEFRQQSFLWAPDLSSYESIAYLPFNIPMYGSHVSLFALLWGISSVIYAYYNMKTMDMGGAAAQNPAMKYMQYFMPIMFIVFFNSYASGLTIYMFFSNLFTIAQTIITKNFILDEEKIRAKLELQLAKPKKKKGKFAQRLEEAMKQQQLEKERRSKR